MIKPFIYQNFLIFICLVAFFELSNASNVAFFKGTFSELAERAKAENKPFFVCIYKEDCLSSQKMNDTTFLDEEVARYVSQNYIAYRAEYSSFDGFEICEKLNITHYPNVTFFTPEAKPIYEVEGYQKPRTFIGNLSTELANMQQPNFCPGSAAHFHPKHEYHIPQPAIKYPEGFKFDIPVAYQQEGLDFDSPNVLFRKGLGEDPPTISKRYDVPNLNVWKNMSSPLLPKTKPAFESEEMLASIDDGQGFNSPITRGLTPNKPKEKVIKEKPLAKTRNIESPKENYDLNNYPDARYGVQVGAFKDISTAQIHLKKYKEAGEEIIILTQAVVNEQEVYKLVLGAYDNRKDAEQKLYDLKNDAGIEGFILDFNKVR
jgi:thioredoxin-related protein